MSASDAGTIKRRYEQSQPEHSQTASNFWGRIAGNFSDSLLLAGVLFAIVAITAVALYSFTTPAPLNSFGLSVVVAGAAAALGALGGFLFGVPKYKRPIQGPDGRRSVDPNSNLEQVSDWLTKIIVGVGLVQFGDLIAAPGRLGNQLALAFGQGSYTTSGAVYGLSLAIGSSVVAFLLQYMWTQTRLFRVLESG